MSLDQILFLSRQALSISSLVSVIRLSFMKAVLNQNMNNVFCLNGMSELVVVWEIKTQI